ncbi:MAG TPA: hypothetical protein VN706_00360 [Gemmatimonadaceae bacterium]|nr:hypothetical protein [Gemmatimonadaceae bacterium]
MRNQSPQGALLVAARTLPLSSDWFLAATAPNGVAEPGQLHAHKLDWIPARVPGTVAQALAAAGRWDLDDEDDFDASDWWYRTSFEASAERHGARSVLRFDGLATLADVWLNGAPLVRSTNMFESHEVDVTDSLHDRNELVICCRSLNSELARRRPRPRWKTKLVRQQQLRWIRTTLLGRIPGWTIPAAPVGPWRPVVLETRGVGALWNVALRSSVENDNGVVEFSALTNAADEHMSAELVVGETAHSLNVTHEEDVDDGERSARLSGVASIANVVRWWPHTHGEPKLYSCALRISASGETTEISLGAIGFRDVAAVRDDDEFGLCVNGRPVFCRGACWTTTDVVGLSVDEAALRGALHTLRDGGANMVRVGGTMVYESDAFYRLCDELGILVWQDFMFANMDYPGDDPQFVESVRREAAQQLRRLAAHPCVVTYCGNSEVEQQAAMLGMPRDAWRNTLFAEVLPSLCNELHPGVPYVPSTPSGGTLPFHTRSGLTHYYGIGAYLRPFADVRGADVKFTPECLGFANVPEPEVVDTIMRGDPPAIHDPRWKKRTPRDTGAGWDFEDVRDHCMRALFGADVERLRYCDTRRYLDLARVATGEAMSRVFAEWRRAESRCRGALVWFYRDLWPGAGWGVTDSRGVPKACYYYLRRAWQPVAIAITDEGLNGIRLHVVNERRDAWNGAVSLMLVRDGATIVAERSLECEVAASTTASFDAEEVLGGFHDTAYAYRFGPPAFDVAIAALRNVDGSFAANALHFATALDVRPTDATLAVETTRAGDDTWSVRLESDRFLYGVRFDVRGFAPDDNYFHLAPGREHRVQLRRTSDAETPRGYVEALNLRTPARLEIRA